MVGSVNPVSGQAGWFVPGIGSGAFGQNWDFILQYNNATGSNFESGSGINWQTQALPQVTESDWSDADVMFRNLNGHAEYMTEGGTTGAFDSLFGNQSVLSHDSTNKEYTLVKPDGTTLIFDDLTHLARPGLLKKQISPGGKEILLSSNPSQPTMVASRVGDSQGQSIEEQFVYEFHTSGTFTGLLHRATLRRRVLPSGAWENVSRATYEYYDGSDANGSLGDLQKVITETWIDTTFTAAKTTYMRYWKSGASDGFEHGLKFMVSPATYQAILDDSENPLTATDEELAQFADAYYEYDGSRRVKAAAS